MLRSLGARGSLLGGAGEKHDWQTLQGRLEVDMGSLDCDRLSVPRAYCALVLCVAWLETIANVAYCW